MKFSIPPRVAAVLSALAAVLSIGAITVALSIDTNNGTGSVTVTLNDQGAGSAAPDKKVEVPKDALNDAQVALADHQGSRDETPTGEPASQAQASTQAQQQIKQSQAPLPTAGASAGFKGCYTRFVRNQSSRGGVRPQWQVLHYTVSPNRPGWSDVNAVVALFDRSSAQASSNFVIDGEGHCAYIVPIEAKAWTQAGGNPYSISYEVINTGSESQFMGTAGYAKLRSVMLQVRSRTGIPVSAGGNSGCVPTRKGAIQHADLGLCGGGHHDIQPFSKAAVLKRIGASAVKPISKGAKQRCRELNRIRKYHKTHRPLPSHLTRRSHAILAGEKKNKLVCHYGPPGRIRRT
jgi:hypothetical protein